MKRFFLIINFLLIASLGMAQAPRIQWEKTIGGNKDDELYSLQQTSDGGYILGGSSNSGISGDKAAGTCASAHFDYWVVKIDCEGNMQWQKDIGGGGGDNIVNSIRQTADGGYIVGGYSQTGPISCQKTFGGYGIDDWWAMKLDGVGNIQWQVTYGGSCNDYLNSVEQTADHGYILGGDSRSNVTGDKVVGMCGNINCQVLSDYWIVKLDSTGALEWQNDYGSTADVGVYPGDDDLNAIHQTKDKGYILGGSSNGGISCSKSSNAFNASYDFWIIKTDSTGNIQWQQQIGGNGLDALNDIHQTADGGYIAGGTSSSNASGNKTSNTWYNTPDYYVVKMDSAGNIQWQKDIGGDNYDGLNSIEQTTDHGYILGGFSNSDSSGNKTSNPLGGIGSGQYDYWIVKLDSIGNIQWQLDIGRNDTQAVLFAVQQTVDEGYILGGVSNPSSANLSGKVNNVGNPYGDQFGGTGTHYWVVKLGDCSAGFCSAPPQQRDSICLGNSVTLTGITEYGGFNWEAIPGGSDTSSLSCTTCIDPVATPTQTTRYVELSALTPDLYCGDTATVVVLPLQTSITVDTLICAHDSAQLHIPVDTSGGMPSIEWAPPYYLSNNTISDPTCKPLSSISYYVTLKAGNNCKTIDTFNVTVYNLIKPVTADTLICQNTVAPELQVKGDSLTWHTAPHAPGTAVQPVINTTSAPVTDTLYISNRCGEAPVYVQIISMPSLSLDDTMVCWGSVVQLKAPAANDIRYRWNTGDTTCCITVDTAGTYVLTASNQCGDTTSSAAISFAACNDCLWAPDAFTPNGDGKNDRFYVIDRCGMGTYHVIIVNRYGEVVYNSVNLSEGWDGTFNGQPVDIGTYFYYITATPQVLGEKISLKGNVTVIR